MPSLIHARHSASVCANSRGQPARQIRGHDARHATPLDQPAICPEKGEYFATQVELFNYIIKCSKHGVDREVFSKIYEREKKKIDPVKLCRRNILDITNACELYSMENGFPKQWSMTLILKTGYLQNNRICPSGGFYNIKSTPGESTEVDCSCSVHSGTQK